MAASVTMRHRKSNCKTYRNHGYKPLPTGSQARNYQGGREVSLPFFENWKKILIFGENAACVNLWVTFLIKYAVLRVFMGKNFKISPSGNFLLCAVNETLSKFSNSKKPPLPKEIIFCTPSTPFHVYSLLDFTIYFKFTHPFSYPLLKQMFLLLWLKWNGFHGNILEN